MKSLKWYIVSSDIGEPRDLGAFGLVGGKTACIVSFYDDRDGNMDGHISWSESFFGSSAGAQLALMTQCAPGNRKLLMHCKDLPEVQHDALKAFATGLMIDGITAAYFMRGVGAAGGMLANKITLNMVKNLMIRQGFASTVKQIMKSAHAAGVY